MKKFNVPETQEPWSGKPGAWYVVLDPDQWYLLNVEFNCGAFLTDFIEGTDGNYYAPVSAVFDGTDDAGIMGSGMFASANDFPLTYVNISMQPSLFGGWTP